jgi:hypothetical protein
MPPRVRSPEQKAARKQRDARARMAREFPEAAALAGHLPLTEADIAITRGMTHFVEYQHQLARSLQLECSNRLPYLGVTMQETTPLITERPLDPGQTTEQATPSFHLPDELWVHILRRVCSLTLGEKGDSRAVLQMRALTHATRAAFGAVFAQAYAAASLSKRRRFVIDVLAGATVETPFTYSGERRSPPSCLAAADRSLSHAGRIGKGIARHRGLGPSRALHQRHIAVGHG